MNLKTYRSRRDFKKSPEPFGRETARTSGYSFVVQEHAARRLHYDFRLEVDGVLKSWSIPKGPSLDPRQKRLAVPTEDHPLEYAKFEGIIPEGYGAGTVSVWDRGTYRSLRNRNGKSVSMRQALREGKLEFVLEGTKLHGAFALVRTGMDGNWLLIKKKDAHATTRRIDPASVLSGRTLEEIAKNGSAPRKRKSKRSRSPSKSPKTAELRIGSRTLPVSNLEKELFPGEYTKADVIEYYRKIAPVMLPYLRGRLVSMQRFPDGLGGFSFFQKEIPKYFPDWISRATVPRREGGEITHVVCNDVATLVYLAAQACLVPHVGLSRTDRPDTPDRIIFDLDPSENAGFALVKKTAFLLRRLLENELGLESLPMLTGSRGVHVLVTLKRRESFDAVRAFAQGVAGLLTRRYPRIVTVEHRKAKRGPRIYLDVARNGYGQTAVPPYSLRALPGAPVATPLTWEELRSPRMRPQSFALASIFERLDRVGDPWKPLPPGRSLSQAVRALERAARTN